MLRASRRIKATYSREGHGGVTTLNALQIKPGSSSLLVIQIGGSKIATSAKGVPNWKTLVNQWSNEHSFGA
jgi:hypothetical protein